MGFVSEQGSIWKDQVSRCERRDFVDCVPRALLKERVPQDSRWLAGIVGSECLWGNTIPRLDGIEFVAVTIWSRTGSTITIWDGWGRANFGQ